MFWSWFSIDISILIRFNVQRHAKLFATVIFLYSYVHILYGNCLRQVFYWILIAKQKSIQSLKSAFLFECVPVSNETTIIFFIAWSEQKMYKWKLFPFVSGFFLLVRVRYFLSSTDMEKQYYYTDHGDHIAQHSQTQSHQFLSFSLCRCFVSIMLCVESLLRASSGLFTFHFLLHDLTSILSWVGVRMLLCICGISAQFIHIYSVCILVCMRTREYVCVHVYLRVGCSTTRRSVYKRYFYLATCSQALQNGCT